MDIKIGVNMNINGCSLTVFEDGRIWRNPYTVKRHRSGLFEVKGQWLSPTDNGKGYMRINTAKAKGKRVHRLVAEAFLPNYSESLTVDHIDGNKSNNDVSNLRMMSHVQNMRSYQKPKGGSSRYRGVTRRSDGTGGWVAQINVGGNVMRIGSFGSEHEAALAYNHEAVRHGFSEEALNLL